MTETTSGNLTYDKNSAKYLACIISLNPHKTTRKILQINKCCGSEKETCSQLQG